MKLHEVSRMFIGCFSLIVEYCRLINNKLHDSGSLASRYSSTVVRAYSVPPKDSRNQTMLPA